MLPEGLDVAGRQLAPWGGTRERGGLQAGQDWKSLGCPMARVCVCSEELISPQIRALGEVVVTIGFTCILENKLLFLWLLQMEDVYVSNTDLWGKNRSWELSRLLSLEHFSRAVLWSATSW